MIEDTKAWIEAELERLASVRIALVEGDEGSGRAAPTDSRTLRIEARIRRLGQIVAALPNVDPDMLDPHRAGLGSQVTVLEPATGEEVVYTLLAGSSIDVDADEVSLGSPIGQALLGTRPGDEVSVQTPRRIRELVVRDVVTLARMLDTPDSAALRSRPPAAITAESAARPHRSHVP